MSVKTAWSDDTVWLHDVGLSTDPKGIRRVSCIGKVNGVCGVAEGETWHAASEAAYQVYHQNVENLLKETQ